MSPANDEFLPTRSSLLSRLKHASDAAGWREFVDNYGRLVFQVCLRSGLHRQEAEDVVQETITAVAQQMPRRKKKAKVCARYRRRDREEALDDSAQARHGL